MVAFAKRFFDGIEGIRISQKRGLTTINIRDHLLARFKKLDKNKHSRNLPTQQSFLFKAQLELPGIPSKLTHLDVGYVLNDLQTGIDGVYITCPYGKGLAWLINLDNSSSGGNVIRFTSSGPTAPPSQDATTRAKRFKPKDSDGKKKDEGKS